MRSSLFPAFVVAACLPAAAFSQTTFVWTGAFDGAWSAAANWTPSTGSPGASDIVEFSGASANTDVSLGAERTIGQLRFLAGAAAYAFSDGQLVISRANNTVFISHQAGNEQRFDDNVVLHATGTNRQIEVGAGSTLTFAGGLGVSGAANSSITLSGGGTVNILNTSILLDINNFVTTGAGTTLNYNSSNAGRPYTLTASDGGRVNLLRLGFSGTLTVNGNGSAAYAQVAGNLFSGSNTTRLNPAANGTVTLGAEVDGGGTVAVGRQILLNYGGTVANGTMRFDAKANNVLNLTGTIADQNAAGTGTKVEIAGAGIVRYSGTVANTSVTPILISDGTLELAKSEGVDAIGGGSVTIEETGTLRLLASHQIANSTAMVFTGGLFETGGFTETLGNLSVGVDGGTIDFGGEAGSLTFASLSSIAGTLTITGWNQSASITFVDGSGWDAEALARVIFAGYGSAAFDEATGLLYAIPEPSSAVVMAALGALAAVGLRRRRD